MNAVTDPAALGVDERAVTRFLTVEARLQDEHQYDAWEALWDEEALYWVPAGGDDIDPSRQVSYIYDNRARIATRIRQLKSGWRHAQNPASRLRRVLSNAEVERVEEGLVHVAANFVLVEARHGNQFIWAGRTQYRLKPEGASFRLRMKKVLLINSDQPISTLAFII